MIILLLLFSLIHISFGVIYHASDSDYERMPPLFGLDEYDSCINQGRIYCVAKFDLIGKESNNLIKYIHEYSAHFKHFNHTYIERGICINKTCKKHIKNKDLNKTEDLKNVLEACQNEIISSEYSIEARLSQIYYCDTRGQETEYQLGDWLVAGLVLTLLLLNTIGTIYSIINSGATNEKKLKVNKLLSSFSIINNWNWLISDSKNDDQLKCINGLRCVITTLTFFAHVAFFYGGKFMLNTHDYEKVFDTEFFLSTCNGMIIVQIFFFLSGFLLTFHLEFYAEKNPIKWSLFPQLILQRWIRLAPACGIVIAVTATWLKRLASGPLWKLFVTNNTADHCRKYWWQHLLFINNYMTENKYCSINTWHLGVDTQLFIIGGLLYVGTASRPQLRNKLLGLLLVIGIVAPAMHVYYDDLDGLTILYPETYRDMLKENYSFHYMHKFAHNNLPCYIIGMMSGLFYYKWQKQGARIPENNVLNYVLGFMNWALVIGVFMYFKTGNIFYVNGERASLFVRVAYAALHRPVYGIILAATLFSMLIKSRDKFIAFFESNFWVIPCRLSYGLFLVHFILFHIIIGYKRELMFFSYFDMITLGCGVLLMSYILAIPLCLFVEAPINRLFKLMTTKEKDN